MNNSATSEKERNPIFRAEADRREKKEDGKTKTARKKTEEPPGGREERREKRHRHAHGHAHRFPAGDMWEAPLGGGGEEKRRASQSRQSRVVKRMDAGNSMGNNMECIAEFPECVLEAWPMAQWASWGIEYLGEPIVVLTTAMAGPKSISATRYPAELKNPTCAAVVLEREMM